MKKLNNLLIIGIGNNTREDDGLGWAFLDALENKSFKATLQKKYQLMVEDAALIADFETVIFVDACKTEIENGFIVETLLPSKDVAFSTHSVPPNQILNLCETLFNKNPTAYVIKIAGNNWDFKIGLSNIATVNLKNALNYFLNNFAIEKNLN